MKGKENSPKSAGKRHLLKRGTAMPEKFSREFWRKNGFFYEKERLILENSLENFHIVLCLSPSKDGQDVQSEPSKVPILYQLVVVAVTWLLR